MFEFSVALKYLLPKKKQLSVSLISLMSVGVISLVVWLLLLFLSVTEGIEKNWMEKLTTLNAPLRINPTPAYYHSYYYQIDSISDASGYTLKSIGEKAEAENSHPYLPEFDREIPSHFPLADYQPDGTLKDPVKIAYQILGQLGLTFQEYEISGALLRLELMRPQSRQITAQGDLVQTHLTQVSYIASFPGKNPHLATLLNPPTAGDFNNLFYLANVQNHGIEELLHHTAISQVKTSSPHWRIPPQLLPEQHPLNVTAHLHEGRISHFVANLKGGEPLVRQGNQLFFRNTPSPFSTPLFSEHPLQFKVVSVKGEMAKKLHDVHFAVEGELQGIPLRGEIEWEGLEIVEAKASHLAPLAPSSSAPIYLAKNFQDNGVRIGDRGYLSYTSRGAGSTQEQRVAVDVAGFYDPGIMAVGNKCILAPPAVVRAISLSSNSYHLDPSEANGISVWIHNLNDVQKVQAALRDAFQNGGIGSYWNISTFREYDFAKDLMQQFQSDKYLFSLVGIIILTVACCNIISLLVLLVNDKKKEIGILQAMGASTKSIALIFGLCGTLMGLLSSALGIGAAYLTLHNLDYVVRFLSFLQGHEAFNAAFYGASLPNALSENALCFILITTPILSLLAGLVPAIKACRLRPSAILRSE